MVPGKLWLNSLSRLEGGQRVSWNLFVYSVGITKVCSCMRGIGEWNFQTNKLMTVNVTSRDLLTMISSEKMNGGYEE